MALFQEGWQKHYPGMVEWMDPKMHGGLKSVDPAAMTVTTDLETIKADLVNVIPAQMAGSIARDAGLANETGFCPIDADQHEVEASIPTSSCSAMPRSPAPCRSRPSPPTARPRWWR